MKFYALMCSVYHFDILGSTHTFIAKFRTNLITAIIGKVSVPSQEKDQSSICVEREGEGVDFASWYDFHIVPTVWYFLFFILIHK